MKKRLDQLLVERGLIKSRTKAAGAVKEAAVLVDGCVVTKPAVQVAEGAEITLVKNVCPYVSRGGLKLDGAIKAFNISFAGKTVLDLGSSTGGFTDCALKHGAKKVIAVDVGSGQLDESLRADESVVCRENTDIRALDAGTIKSADVIVADISFVSLAKVFGGVINAAENQEFVLLIKPQFEAEPALIKKHKGVIKDKALSEKIAKQAAERLVGLGLKQLGFAESPIKGGDGNTEYITYFVKRARD